MLPNKGLIYISNTRIPSEKANTYQSMVMCEAFAPYFKDVEFWYPDMRNTPQMDRVTDVYQFYNVANIFKTIKLQCFDSDFLYEYKPLNRYWFLARSFSFALNYAQRLKTSNNSNIVFTRDIIGLNMLSLLKKFKVIEQKIYFEAHYYSKNIASNIESIDGLIVINHYLKELYEQDGITNILVAHDGVKIEEYTQIKPKISTTTINVVYIGNLFEWKGVYTLAKSMEYLNHKNIKLTIVGGSNDTLPQFKKYIKGLKIQNIELIGFVKKIDTLQYIQKADIVVLPNSAKDKMSYYTSPLKLFEYMASKRVIVASKLPSIEEILEDGKNAILFEPDNPKDLAEKMKWCLENDTTKLIEKAFLDVQEYSWEKRAQKIIRFMNEK